MSPYLIYLLVLLLSLCFLRLLRRKPNGGKGVKIKGTVVLMKKHMLDFTDPRSSILDRIYELLGFGVSFQLVSATVSDPDRQERGVLGDPASLEGWITKPTSFFAGEAQYDVTFYWNEDYGIPGAVIVKSMHHYEFFLKSLTLEGVPGKGRVHFVCNSWVYPAKKYNYDRIFFTNETYLRRDTPRSLIPYRDDELQNLRGDGIYRELKRHERVYNYDVYNDLADPVKDSQPILGGTEEYPYPRRGRTGRRRTTKDPKIETRLPLIQGLNIYVPRDERFGRLKMSDLIAYVIKALIQALLPFLKALLYRKEFQSLHDELNMYRGGLPIPNAFAKIRKWIPFEMIKELLRTDGERLFRFPMPQVIKFDDFAWRTNEEFIREMLAGVNPLVIRRAEVQEVVEILHPNDSAPEMVPHTERNHHEHKLHVAKDFGEFFILDHYDLEMSYLSKINATSTKSYASKTLLSYKNGTLKLEAIMLGRHPDGNPEHCINETFFPPIEGEEDKTKEALWNLAKAYVAVNDSGHHQLISHWLKMHAVIEPFVIASHRQLSVMHPIHKLLSPHFRDTMNINALARQSLINGGGILEKTVFPGKYALRMSSKAYKDWNFKDQALPKDLENRGIMNPYIPNKLLIEDYPYAVDGLAIWSAIEKWVIEYCSIYYDKDDDDSIQKDEELQKWWKEVREVGHGDLEGENRLPEIKTFKDLTESCTIIIWVASALHAAVNFGQYAYAGYLPNRPTISRSYMPKPGTTEYEELEKDPDGFFLRTITSPQLTILGVALIEILSMHTSDEIYLGQRVTPEWTTNRRALDASERFQKRLVEIQKEIDDRNNDVTLKNRNGPVKVPYTLLYPNTFDPTHEVGLMGRGIPNSVSI